MIYLSIVRMYVKATMEYRMAFIAGFIGNVVRKIAEYLSIWVLLSSFRVIDGWSFGDVLMLYNINQFAISFSGMIFWKPMLQLESEVHKGSLDTLMTKPIGLFSHLICKNFDISFLANLSLSTAIFVYYFIAFKTVWNVQRIIMFLLIMAGAILIYSALHIFIGTLSFWIVKTDSVFSTIMNMRQFVYYPISIYNKPIQFFLTYIFPIAFVNYYPMLYLLGKSETVRIDIAYFPIISIVLGIVLYFLSYLFFCYGARNYSSTGN